MKYQPTDASQAVGDSEPASTHFHHDWEGDAALSTEIVMAVAELTDANETDVEPLYDRIDPDSLNSIFATSDSGRPRSAGALWFSFAECHVTVYETGVVVVQGAN